MARRAPSLSTRRAAILLGAVAAVAVATSAPVGSSAAPRLDAPRPSQLAYGKGIAGRTTASGPGTLRRASWGGPHTTATGETVHVFASDSYPVDETRTQGWADYLARLLHGPELSSLELYLAPLDEVEDVCGRGALACYSSARNSIVAPGDAPSPELSAEAIVAHEYGHHVAANRANPPWNALDWGTKRWATYVGVCARTAAGELFPGDEREYYRLNPGEAFAESYRVLNQTRLGVPVTPWQIVDERLAPDARALELIAADVAEPWTTSTVVGATGRIAKRGSQKRTQIATPLDGRLRVSLRMPAKGRYAVELVDRATGRRLARSTATAPALATLEATVCGARAVVARVTAVRGSGAYRLTIARP
jgi:hypothetical protein